MDDADLLVPFERDAIKDDYRRFYAIKRNNFFASIQGLPELWELFCKLDEIWHRGIIDLEVSTKAERVWPLVLYMNAHAKMRIAMELAFSSCAPEARSILRDAVEHVAYAHYMLHDPAKQVLWLNKDKPGGKKPFKKAFEEYKERGLFAGLGELYQKFSELSEAGSHPTMTSFSQRVDMRDTATERHMVVTYSGSTDKRLFATETFDRLLTCYVMAETFFIDYEPRLRFDDRLMGMRREFESLKERTRKHLISKYGIQPPPDEKTSL